MSNVFDFELVAGDQASEAVARINEAVRDLQPQLDKTKERLQLGGQETQDGLRGFVARLENMSKGARDNVQFIGDMVPPLKMVGELSGKLGALGAVGAAGYGLKKVAYDLREVSREAYNLDVSAKNAGMRVDDFSRLSGAMQILGADSQNAHNSIEGMAKTLKEAASGSNSQVLGALAQIGVQIQKNNDGSVDTLKTLEQIAKVFPTLRPEQQKSVADALGLTPEALALMREGARMKELLAKSDQLGLSVDPTLNQQLVTMNNTMNETAAAWDGLMYKLSPGRMLTKLNEFDGSIKDGLEGVTDLLSNGDFTGLSHALGFISSDDASKLRRIQGDKELYNSLSRRERGAVDAGFMTDAVRKRYDTQYRAVDMAGQLQEDMAAITRPAPGRDNVMYDQPDNNALGLRNKNPGNLRVAPNSTGQNGGFSTFASSEDGLAAMARQLMLYGDRGNNTTSGIIHTYAPQSENNTRGYIKAISDATGFQPQQRVNLHDPDVLKPLMAAMIRHENGTQPFSEKQLSSAIQMAITDDRWSGKRDQSVISQQRFNLISRSTGDTSVAEQQNSPARPVYDRLPEEKPVSIVSTNTRSAENTQPASIIPAETRPQKNNIIQPEQRGTASGRGIADTVAKGLKDALADQPLKLEITMVNENGERRTYNAPNNGRITTPMNF